MYSAWLNTLILKFIQIYSINIYLIIDLIPNKLLKETERKSVYNNYRSLFNKKKII